MKIFFNRVPRYEPYGGGSHFVTAMCEYLTSHGHNVVFHLEENIDVIFMIDPRPGDIGYSINHILAYKNQFPNVKILHRINECDSRKNTKGLDELLIASAERSDSVIFISEWLKKYFKSKGFDKNCPVIYNGCKLDHFFPKREKSQGEKIKIVTHHWSDNWMKGFDLYKDIDLWLDGDAKKEYEFTYIGRYCKEYEPKNTKLVEPLHGASLGEELRNHDIYVTASRFEPCGMHHIEGAASGMPVIYHKDTGGIVELCKNHGEIYESFPEFLNKLEMIKSDLDRYREKIKYDFLDINRCCESFYSEILRLQK